MRKVGKDTEVLDLNRVICLGMLCMHGGRQAMVVEMPEPDTILPVVDIAYYPDKTMNRVLASSLSPPFRKPVYAEEWNFLDEHIRFQIKTIKFLNKLK